MANHSTRNMNILFGILSIIIRLAFMEGFIFKGIEFDSL